MNLENLSALVDAQRILQTLLNTDNIEIKTNQSQFSKINFDSQHSATLTTQSQSNKDRNLDESMTEERKKPLTQEQAEQNCFELEEAR